MWEILLLIVVLAVALIAATIIRRRPHITGGHSAPTYLFSGYDGSYLWYLAELMQKDGARPATETGFVMRGDTAHATYLHKSLDNLYWFNYDNGPAQGDHSNVIKWPMLAKGPPNPAHKADLFKLIGGRPYAPHVAHISLFKYEPGGSKYVTYEVASDPSFTANWSGYGVGIINNEDDYNRAVATYSRNLWLARNRSRTGPPVKYDMFIAPLIPSKRIDNRAFVITLYVMLDGPALRLCDHGFICLCESPDSAIAICLDESTVRVFPQEYPGDGAAVLARAREIVADCEEFFRPAASAANFKVYNMDLLVDENEKCWLLEFNSYFKFYDMLPEPPYSDAMRGITDWIYKYGIKPRLFGDKK